MHWVAPAEKDTASATLEKRLWDAADQFRANSGLKTQEYSAGSPQGPVLGLVFLRTYEYLTGEFAMSAGQGDWLKFDLLRGGARTIGRCDIMHELVHLVEGHHGGRRWAAPCLTGRNARTPWPIKPRITWSSACGQAAPRYHDDLVLVGGLAVHYLTKPTVWMTWSRASFRE